MIAFDGETEEKSFPRSQVIKGIGFSPALSVFQFICRFFMLTSQSSHTDGSSAKFCEHAVFLHLAVGLLGFLLVMCLCQLG